MEAVTLSNSTECSEAASHFTCVPYPFFVKLVKEQLCYWFYQKVMGQMNLDGAAAT